MKHMLFFFLVSLSAWAEAPIPVGDQEALLGNSGVALSGSTAAGLYNPAGLATIQQSRVSATGTLFQNSTQDLSGAATAHSESFQSIPTQLSIVGLWNDYRYAFSVFNVRSIDFDVAFKTDLGGGLGEAPAQVKATGTSLLVGPSIGKIWSEKLFVGASLFVRKDDNFRSIVARVDVNGANQVHVLVHNQEQSSNYSLLPILGASYQLDRDTRLGARLKLPLLPVTGHAKILDQQVGYTVDNLSNVTDASTPATVKKENSKTERPAELAVGIAKVLPGEWRLYGDAAYSLKGKSRPRVTADEEVYLASLALSGGFEMGPPTGKWAAGLFYRQNDLRNEADEVPTFIGVTGGYLKTSEHFDSGIGGYYMFGSGSKDGITNKLTTAGLLVSSTYKF